MNNNIPEDEMGLFLGWTRKFVIDNPKQFSEIIKNKMKNKVRASVYIEEEDKSKTMIIDKGVLVSNEYKELI
jgi:hypothetical protein